MVAVVMLVIMCEICEQDTRIGESRQCGVRCEYLVSGFKTRK